jgi:hypothetical protein
MVEETDRAVELSYLLTVTKLATATQTKFTPIDGFIKRVTISWPRGCNFLVEVIFNHKRTQILPYPSGQAGTVVGIALNDFSERLNPYWPVTRNDPLEMYLINHDDTNSHTISAVVHISGKDVPYQ